MFGSTNNTKVQQFVDVMSHEFEMSLVGELSYFLGLQIRQLNDETFITQTKYAKNLVKKFGLENAKHCDTPMSTTLKLSKDASGKSVEQTLYRGIIGRLLYLTVSRPNISFSVGVCARYKADPKESHLYSVNKIILYVNETSNYGIWYSFDTNASLVGFSDADWQEIAMIGKAHRAVTSSFETTLFLGFARSKTRFPCLWWRSST